MDIIRVTRSYLQLLSPDALRRAELREGFCIEHAHRCSVPFFRFLYGEVGRDYRWRDRLAWTDEQCATHLASPDVSIWVLYGHCAPGGFFELNAESDCSVEIAHFGLMRDYIGQGHGKALLTAAADQAWALGPSRVWLHTCTLDDPAALPNYLARGFEKYDEVVYEAAQE